MSDYQNLLGRREAFDERSRNYQIRPLLMAASITKPRSYTWSCGIVLQQQEGSCVGHSFAHEIAARPQVLPADRPLAMKIYDWAQQHDWWSDTPPQEGTSVLAGVQACQAFGYYTEYRWAGAGSGKALEDLVLTLGYKGPAVLGISWYSSMFYPASNGLLSISGSVAGGHAILANGVKCVWPSSLPVALRTFDNLDRGKSLVRLHNSWGAQWGLNGEAFMTLNDVDRLLHEGGEACIPLRAA